MFEQPIGAHLHATESGEVSFDDPFSLNPLDAHSTDTPSSGFTGAWWVLAPICADLHPKHEYKTNAKIRKDSAWLDYVNLSIERINDWMFETSQRWHAREDNPWVVLSFHPRILGHGGVVFTTTNNIYPKCSRGQGLAGFEAMFANEVIGRYGEVHGRSSKQQAWPTDRQAEVLYPKQLSCEHLLCI